MKIGLSFLGWVHVVLGGLGLGVGVLVCGAILLSADPAHRDLIYILGPIFVLLALPYFIPSFLGGLGLLRGWRWARTLLWLEAALLAPAIPIGTALAGLSIWILLSNRDHKAEAGAIASLERMLARSRKLIVAALAAIGTLGGMIGLGYLFRDQIEDLHPPMALVGPVIFVVTVAIVGLIGGVNAWGGGIAALSPERLLLRRRAQREQAERVAEHKARLVRLLADPVRAKYVERMERGGEYWSDEQIAYDLDREARATCQHLAPIEGAMRQAGLMVKWQQPGFVDADCLIDEAALKQTMPLAESVSYREIESGGRAYEDPPFAMLQCAACNSSIRVRSEQDSQPGIPVFPAPTVSGATER